MEALRPPTGAREDVIRHFEDQGFDVHAVAPGMITISGPAAKFAAHFGVELVLGEDGAYTVGPLRAPEGAELPLTRLPTGVRSLVSAIALEVPMSPDDLREP